MTEWAMKRFWKAASCKRVDEGFAIFLDERSVKTPAKCGLIVPTEEMGTKVAAEWDAQGEKIDPAAMPWTRSANAAIDKVAHQRQEVRDHLAGYAETDLVCYRADGPKPLSARQAAAWDPLIAWVAETYDAHLQVTVGVMPIAQSQEDVARLTTAMAPMSEFQMTGFYDLVSLSGSFVLALAATESWAPAEDLWGFSKIDEHWQIEQWGEDEEAAEDEKLKKQAFYHALAFYQSA
ncbi:MAG: ATP12 family protein [Pseudomonadota bacterium]